MQHRWIAVVNRTDARIFAEKPFKSVGLLKNLLGRTKNREMTTDRSPIRRAKFAGSKSVHKTGGEKSPHEDAAIAFAKRVSEFLRKAHANHLFDALLVVAEPKMMGRVKSEFNKSIKSCTEWLGKDMGHVSNMDLPKLLNLKPSTRVKNL